MVLKNKPSKTTFFVCFSKIKIVHNCSVITNILIASDFTFGSLQKVEKKSPDISSDQYVTSSVPRTGYGTLDWANLDAQSVLLLMPTYPLTGL